MNQHLISVINSCDILMNKTLNEFVVLLKEISIERIDLNLVKKITIKYKNKIEKINDVSTFNVKTPYLIHIFPINNEMLKIIEISVRNTLPYANISNDGEKIIIQISIPNSDKRKILEKKIKSLGEEKKIKLRNIRRNCNNQIKKYIKKNKKPIEYEQKYMKLTQKSIDNVIKNLDTILLQKIKNIIRI